MSKSPLALVIAMGTKKKPKAEKEDDYGDEAVSDIGADAMAAMKKGDSAAFGKAMKAMVKLCMRDA